LLRYVGVKRGGTLFSFLFDFVADFPRRTIDSFLTRRRDGTQLSITIPWGSAAISTQ
jgi:hypothetical protein